MKKDTNILKNIAINIRKERSKLSISQERLAELAGLHRTYIGQIERAEKNITILNLQKISQALNIEISDLIETLS